MPAIHPPATLVPPFREFLPPWLSRQPWYRGTGIPSLRPAGFVRFEDPAGRVGMETHLVADGPVLYQIPMTYRDAPLAGAASALITTAEHSVLGTRWIYDAEADPAWVSELLRLVRTEGIRERNARRVGAAEARGRLLAPAQSVNDAALIEVVRTPTPGAPPVAPGVIGALMGSWYPGGPDTVPVTGCLAIVRHPWRRIA